jgi:hypothetical protein
MHTTPVISRRECVLPVQKSPLLPPLLLLELDEDDLAEKNAEELCNVKMIETGEPNLLLVVSSMRTSKAFIVRWLPVNQVLISDRALYMQACMPQGSEKGGSSVVCAPRVLDHSFAPAE